MKRRKKQKIFMNVIYGILPEWVLQGNFSMLVMDEVIGACNAGLVNEDELREMLEQISG